MAKGELDSKKLTKLVGFVKRNGFGSYSETAACEASGIERSQILRYLIAAELQAFPNLKVPATPAGVLKAKKSGLRWPRVAGFAGISEAKAKELFAEAGGKPEDAYNGRGRPSGTGVKVSTGRRSASKTKTSTATSGRRGAAKRSSAKSAPAGRGKRGTRASASPK